MEAADFFNLDLRRLKIKPGPTTHYLQFFYAGHPLAGQNGMANFARYLASQKLGRWLTPNEVAVHADDNRGNCAQATCWSSRVRNRRGVACLPTRSSGCCWPAHFRSAVRNIQKCLRLSVVTAIVHRWVPNWPRASSRSPPWKCSKWFGNCPLPRLPWPTGLATKPSRNSARSTRFKNRVAGIGPGCMPGNPPLICV
jgi:hypothetical protein